MCLFLISFLFKFPALPLSAAGCLQTVPVSTTSYWGGEVVTGATMLYTTTAPVYTTPCRGGEVVTGATMLYMTGREATHPPQQFRAQSSGESKPSTCLVC
ncbi:hypothetical protein E2C01_081000 [Portunus trituberculatus]|uniref:Secreted protein n=1 Tax=Portunus trituberculatus TaxID=210409 RepID=A0A5B7J135_PORTR|nr:hypothetical protein [Portunus trituberculatus]